MIHSIILSLITTVLVFTIGRYLYQTGLEIGREEGYKEARQIIAVVKNETAIEYDPTGSMNGTTFRALLKGLDLAKESLRW